MTELSPILAAGLHTVDWAILILYAGSTIFLGWWFGRKQGSASEYFVGSGRMNPILIGVSLFATLLSTISYLSFPGETFGKGPAYMANYLVYPIIFLIIGFVIIPVYMKQRVTSAYELLETRLGLSVRLLGATLFLLLRLVWMAVLVYMTAKALSVMFFTSEMDKFEFQLTPDAQPAGAWIGAGPDGAGSLTPTQFQRGDHQFGIRSLLFEPEQKKLVLVFKADIRDRLLGSYFDAFKLDIKPAAAEGEEKQPKRYEFLFDEAKIGPDGRSLTWVNIPKKFVEAAQAAPSWSTYIFQITDPYVPFIVLITGLIAITYTMLGGLRAVVITDLMQTILLYGGALLVIGTVTWKMGGFGWFPTEWHSNWDTTQTWFPTSLSTRVTVIGTLFQVLIWYVCTAAGDQVSVQRFMATKDAKTARKAVAVQLTIAAVVGITLGMVGFALLGYFDANSADLAHFDLKNDSDQMFAHFVSNLLPPVVSGLVLSGLFAAAMSSIDSGVNSITAVVRTDFIDRFRKEKISDRQQVVMARILALVVGLIVVMLSSFVDLVPGNFTSVTNKTVNLLTVPIFCLFFFALFFKKATPLGVWIGALFGTTTAVLIAFSGPFFGFVGEEKDLDPISFQWIAPTTLVVNIGVGCLVSWLDRKFRKIGAAKQPV